MSDILGKPQELIIKKIKKGGHGHHGGAWKVAYADFVTAMMAFFLLLWLLSTTTPEQKKGIADYFTPTVGLKDSRGIGFEGGATPLEPGTSKNTLTNPGIVAGQVRQGPVPRSPEEQREDNPDQEDSGTPQLNTQNEALSQEQTENAQSKGEDAEEEQFKKTQEDILNAFEQTPDLAPMKNQVLISSTPDGLKIELVDDQERPMFAPGSAVMTDTGRDMLKAVGGIILRTTNNLSVTGHTDGSVSAPGATYGNWELSADRANATRRYLSQNVLEPERISRVVGMADRELLLPKEPSSPRNRRITLVLLRNSHMIGGVFAPAARGLLSAPNHSNAPTLVPDAGQPKADAPAPAPQSAVEVPAGNFMVDNMPISSGVR